MTAVVFDTRVCALGEGAFWHPERQQAFWFDILGRRLLTPGAEWRFDQMVSACGWLDRDHLLIASETGLLQFDLRDGQSRIVTALEAENPETRSNDGRADPMGGFWIGTMSKTAARRAGGIWRYYRGQLRRIVADITIPNAICFSADGRKGWYADTQEQQVWTLALDPDGWPEAPPQPFLDLRREGLNPDGAVIDDQGRFWNAQWGAARVACYDPAGQFVTAHDVPGLHSSCPAFIGAALDRLMMTTATENIADPGPSDGQTFVIEHPGARGRPEPRVIL
ncbi:SMP-30/gluconolactonase/LRE family protein [Paracoccus pacificus]|uniref:SMP-30/gluconolactonase/LRE family protein n=1 Tax=Paracoccus pacificus TaxID=1463598 RepID=A0ABW4R7Y8_9RHOB